jgi:hypothetical protein
MSPVFKKCPLTEKPAITILSYTVELDDVYSADQEHIDRRHIRKDEFYDVDIFIAGKRASDLFRKEMKRLSAEMKNSAHSPYLGLKLYFTFRKNEQDESGKKSKIERFYLLDGEDVPQTELLARLQIEYYQLLSAGVEFDSIEVEMGGEAFNIPLGGLFEIGKQ